jgi:hypothetical protein
MLSNLWNQITRVEEESSDDESSLSSLKKSPLHADDIAAAALLTSFPPYGSHRKALTSDNSPLNDLNGPTSVSSLLSGDWDAVSPEKIQRNKGKEGLSVAGIAGLFSFDDLGSDDDGKEKESSSVVSSSSKKMAVVSQPGKSVDVISWNDDELNLWSESFKRNNGGKRYKGSRQKRKGKVGSKNRGYDNMLFNEEIKRQWIQGSEVAGTNPSVGIDVQNGQQDKKVSLVLEEGSSTTSTDYTSSEDGDYGDLVAREHFKSDDDDGHDDNAAAISNTLKEQLDEKSHWMPDVLCKTCYGCEAQFTVFRRRHHCRLCGQVFCSRCSSFFVEIVTTAKGVGSTSALDMQQPIHQTDIRTLRTCKTCYDQVVASGPYGVTEQNVTYFKEDFQSSAARTDPQGTASYNREKLGGSIRSFSQVQDKISSSELDGFQGASSTEFSNLAIVKQKLEEDRMKREMAEKEQKERSQKDDTEVSGPMKNISKITRRFGKLAESAAREAQFGYAGYNDEESILVGTGVRQKEEEPNPSLVPRIATKKEFVMNSNSDAVLPTKHDSSISSSIDDKKRYEDEIKNANRQMRSTAADYLEKMGRELLRSDAPTLLSELGMSEGYGPEFEKWVSKLMTLATKCCVSVKVNIERGDALDIRPYCKVKGEDLLNVSINKFVLLDSYIASHHF